MSTPLIRLRDIRRIYGEGESEVRALDGVSLDINAGEFVAIVGQSGSGKSTLMNLLGCLDTPTSGEYLIRGENVGLLGHDELAATRRRTFGFIFQRYNLLGTATAGENVEVPAIYAGMPQSARRQVWSPRIAIVLRPVRNPKSRVFCRTVQLYTASKS